MTHDLPILNIRRLMSANVPETLDAWRMVVARRRFDGQVPLAELTRLQGLVADTEGECNYSLEFGRDEILRVSYVELTIDTALPLTCQRSMQRFLLPVKMTQRLGLIREEDEESSLPEEYEPLLVPEDGQLRPLDLVEDELVLAVPVVPLSPYGEAVDKDWAPTEEEIEKANPFAALAALKKQ
ncbi:uncharacterized protein M2299_002958 [Stenotrophomonas sp. 1278]|nr:uncharacterized protein [Stenotrophomonas sp. 1278]